MVISEIKLWCETVGTGDGGNGFSVRVNSVISDVTTQIGSSFIFSYPDMIETIYNPSNLTLQKGDMIEILYGNNGDEAHDQGNTNIFIVGTPSSVPLPAAVWLFGSGLLSLLGVRRKMRR